MIGQTVQVIDLRGSAPHSAIIVRIAESRVWCRIAELPESPFRYSDGVNTWREHLRIEEDDLVQIDHYRMTHPDEVFKR